jgi:hypothetical protein
MLTRQRNQFPGFAHVQCEWLVDDHVLSRRQGHPRDRGVGFVGGGDHDQVYQA